MARCRCLLFIWNIKPLDTEVDQSWLHWLEKCTICFSPFFFFHFFSSALHRLQQKRASSAQVVVEWCFFWGWLMKAAAHKNQKCSCSSDKRCWLSCWSALWLLAHLLFLLFFLGVLYLCVCLWTCVVSMLMWWAVFLGHVIGSSLLSPHLSISSTWLSLLQLSSLWCPHWAGPGFDVCH